jgi:hypothetical protein
VIVIAALGAAAEFATFARSDMAFLLYAAERVLDGARLYVDVVEINPPLIVALNIPAVLLARFIGASDILVYRALMVLVLLGSLWFSDRVLRPLLGECEDALRYRFGLILAFALFLAPGNDFGQREHLLVAFSSPYLLLAAGRIAGRPAAAGEGFLAGALAGLGLALKPHFLLVWAAIEGYAAWRLRARRPSYEALGTLITLVAYLAGVALVTPQYFRLVELLGPAYAGFGHDPFLHVLVTAPGAALCILAGLAALALRHHSRHPALWSVLAVAMVASFIAAAAQQKGWVYHFYPARVFALTLLALAVLDVCRPLKRRVPRIYAAVAFAALGVSVLSAIGSGVTRVRHRDAAREAEQAQLDQLVVAVRRYMPRGGSLFSLSYTIGSSFPLVNYSGVRWASRFPHLWILEAVYHDELYEPAPLRYHTPEEMGPAERFLNEAVSQDLARHRPDVLLILRHARDVPQNSLRRLDYVGYFGRDPRIARELRQYRLAEDVGEYHLYVRARTPEQPGARPASQPGRYDVARSGAVAQGRSLLAEPGFLASSCLFLVLGALAYGFDSRGVQLPASPSRARQGPA